MTPADLARAIRTAPNDDAAPEVAEDHALHIVSVADASQAAAVALARQSRAAEISAWLRTNAEQWSGEGWFTRAKMAEWTADDIDAGRI